MVQLMPVLGDEKLLMVHKGLATSASPRVSNRRHARWGSENGGANSSGWNR
jgi:hypothetical protein